MTVNLLTDVLAPRYTLPAGYDSWAIKSVRPDLTTRYRFRWPYPGGETDVYPLYDHDDPCPQRIGDGLCVALNWAGMASSGFPARTLLLVAYRQREARGDASKLRVPQAAVIDIIDGEQLLIESGNRANLFCADLTCAYLAGADLARANLARANLADANLRCADLRDANLARAYLGDANLTRVNLTRADLTCADLRDANLTRATLAGANLTCATRTTRADLA